MNAGNQNWVLWKRKENALNGWSISPVPWTMYFDVIQTLFLFPLPPHPWLFPTSLQLPELPLFFLTHRLLFVVTVAPYTLGCAATHWRVDSLVGATPTWFEENRLCLPQKPTAVCSSWFRGCDLWAHPQARMLTWFCADNYKSREFMSLSYQEDMVLF